MVTAGVAEKKAEAVERVLALRPAVVARMQAAVPPDLQAELGNATAHQLQAVLRLPEEGMSMRELATTLGISGAAASALADRLVAHGMVERSASPCDRRVVRLVPTAKGRDLGERFREAQRRAIQALLERLQERQVEALVEIMETIVAGSEDARRAEEPAEAAR